MAVFTNLITANDGHPQMGRELNTFMEAGFIGVRTTASFDAFGTAEDVAFLLGWFFSPNVIVAATAHGLATHEQFKEWRDDLEQWKSHPGAFGALAFGEAIASKP